MAEREILIEIVRVGDSMKISALDPASGLEAVAIGPANAARADLEQIAVRKLERMLAEREEPPKPPRPGKVV